MIEYIVAFAIGFGLGSMASLSKKYTDEENGPNKDQETIAGLRKEIEYYKDLCLWHVEEKEKLKREHYIK